MKSATTHQCPGCREIFSPANLVIHRCPATQPESPRKGVEPTPKCKVCGYELIKVTTREAGWQQWVCPNIGKNNSLGHTIEPIGYLQAIETQRETGRQTNRATALNIFVRSCGWLKNKLADNPDAQCGCGSCSLCAYRYFESSTVNAYDANQAEIAGYTARDEAMRNALEGLRANRVHRDSPPCWCPLNHLTELTAVEETGEHDPTCKAAQAAISLADAKVKP